MSPRHPARTVRHGLLPLTALLPGIAAAAQLGVAITSLPDGYVPYQSSLGRVLGWEFTVTQSGLSATQLAFFDFGGDGLVAAHDVGLYERDTKNLLASLTIPAGTTATLADRWWRVVDLPSPISLLPGTAYVVAGGWLGNTDPWVWDRDGHPTLYDVPTTSFVTASGITPADAARYEDDRSSLEFPDKIDPPGPENIPPARRYFLGPNLTLIPEPAGAAAFLALAAAALARTRRGQPVRAARASPRR